MAWMIFSCVMLLSLGANLVMLVKCYTTIRRVEHMIAIAQTMTEIPGTQSIPMQPMRHVRVQSHGPLVKGQTAAEAMSAIKSGQAYIRRAYGERGPK